MDASITITGNVGSEIDVRGGDDWRYASFRLAMTPRTRRPTGWVDGETTWIGISCRQALAENCLLYTSPSPRDGLLSRMPSSA